MDIIIREKTFKHRETSKDAYRVPGSAAELRGEPKIAQIYQGGLEWIFFLNSILFHSYCLRPPRKCRDYFARRRGEQ